MAKTEATANLDLEAKSKMRERAFLFLAFLLPPIGVVYMIRRTERMEDDERSCIKELVGCLPAIFSCFLWLVILNILKIPVEDLTI